MSDENSRPEPVRVIPLSVPERTAQALVDGCALHNAVRIRRGLRPLAVAEYLAGCVLTGQDRKLTEDRQWIEAQVRPPADPGGSAPAKGPS